jgi:hypothetical protein
LKAEVCAIPPTILLLTLVLGMGVNVRATAQEDDDEIVLPAAPQFVVSERQFDDLILRGGGVEVIAGNRQFSISGSADVDAEINQIDRVCSLTEKQRKKLQLAGRGDVSRFRDYVSELRRKYAGVPLDREKYAEVMNLIPRLSSAPQFLIFQDASLFQKTLHHCLDAEQLEKYRMLERGRQYKIIESAIPIWRTMRGSGITDEIRQKFFDTLIEHGKIPKAKYLYAHYMVMLEIGRLEERLKPLCTDAHWTFLQLKIDEARQIEPHVRLFIRWPFLYDEEDGP